MTVEPTILAHGTIRIDAASEPVEALAIADGRILAAGELGDVEGALGTPARRVDLNGLTVVPGLVESHVHPIFFGLTRHWVDCRSPENASVEDIVRRLEQRAAGVTAGAWLRGWGYDDTLLRERRHLTRDDLDRVSTEVPIAVSHISGHFLAANTKALELAGISEHSPDPAEGRFVRDDNGSLTGLMWEMGAVNAVLDAVPDPSSEDLEGAAEYAMGYAVSRGMTAIHDLGVGLMAGLSELDTWEKLARARRVPLRVSGYIRGDLLEQYLERNGGFDAPIGHFELRGTKYWSDGSIQGLSAALLQPYSCAEEASGDLLFDRAALADLILRVDRAGGQCAVHANGDRAIQTVIEALQDTLDAGGRRDARHRVEHLQMASAIQFKELAAINAAGSIFANHVYYWGDRHRDVFIGTERAARIDPSADAVSAGLHFGLHSDCPITPMDPLRTLWTAVTRRTSGGEILGPDQRLTPAQALHALTADSAWLVHAESRRGTLHPGMDADLAVLDTDLLSCPPDNLEDVGVEATMVGGDWVYGPWSGQ